MMAVQVEEDGEPEGDQVGVPCVRCGGPLPVVLEPGRDGNGAGYFFCRSCANDLGGIGG